MEENINLNRYSSPTVLGYSADVIRTVTPRENGYSYQDYSHIFFGGRGDSANLLYYNSSISYMGTYTKMGFR